LNMVRVHLHFYSKYLRTFTHTIFSTRYGVTFAKKHFWHIFFSKARKFVKIFVNLCKQGGFIKVIKNVLGGAHQ
jgi:hypothetical protein